MLNFRKKVIITGIEKKTKQDGSGYILIHVLGDEGVTVSCKYNGEENKIFDIQKMNEYMCDFSFVGGKYPKVEILDITVK